MTRPGMPLLLFVYPTANRQFTARLADLADPHVVQILRIYQGLYGVPQLLQAPPPVEREIAPVVQIPTPAPMEVEIVNESVTAAVAEEEAA